MQLGEAPHPLSPGFTEAVRGLCAPRQRPFPNPRLSIGPSAALSGFAQDSAGAFVLLRDGVSSFCLGLRGWLCSGQAVHTQEVSPPRPAPAPHPHSCPLSSRTLSFPGAGSSLVWPPSSSFLQVGHSHLWGRPSQTPTKFLSSPSVGLEVTCSLLSMSAPFASVHGLPWWSMVGNPLAVQGCGVQSLVGEPRPRHPGASQPSCRSC